jgi:hypothetical protein
MMMTGLLVVTRHMAVLLLVLLLMIHQLFQLSQMAPGSVQIVTPQQLPHLCHIPAC